MTELRDLVKVFIRWSTQVTAHIKIPVIHRLNSSKSYKLILSAIPYSFPNGPTHQDVAIYLDGNFLTQLRLANGGYAETQAFLPPCNPTSLDTSSMLTFVIPNSAIPAEVGQGVDQRRLGIGLRRLELQRSN